MADGWEAFRKSAMSSNLINLSLWCLLQQVNLTDAEDTIAWHITADGRYSASSAYAVQFFGRIQQPNLESVWKICAEGKVKFFLWLTLQNRNWTAERRRARGLPHDDLCCLCDQEFETAFHLVFGCSFAKEVWANFLTTDRQAVLMASSSTSLDDWWLKINQGKADEQHKRRVATSVYTIWHIWKERGRRMFQDKSLMANAVAGLIRADLEVLFIAKGKQTVQVAT